MKNSSLLLITLLLISTSCSRQTQVWMTELMETHQADHEGVIRIHMDKEGDLYPSKEVYIPYGDFFDGNSKNRHSGQLRYYFTGGTGIAAPPDTGSHFGTRSNQLAKAYEINANNRTVIFNTAQDQIRTNLKNTLSETINVTTTKTLVIFIHGFNDPNPTGSFQNFRDKIRTQIKANDLTYLEVYWDGLTANQGDPKLSKIWGPAQYNSAQIAASLREVINSISTDTKIRVICHSLGSSVGTGALFNTTSKWKNWQVLGHYTQTVKVIPAPKHADIRLGIIAPSIPGVETFKDFSRRNWACSPENNNINKVVVGYNFNDYAVTKRFMKSDFLSTKAGATTLGADYDGEVDNCSELMNEMGFANIFTPIAFNVHCRKEQSEEHGLYFYLQNAEKTQMFIQEMFK